MVVLRPGGRASALFLLVLLSACSGDQSPTDPTADVGIEPDPGAGDELVISGSVGDGPATGADIVVTDGNGAVVAETTSDSEAGYRVTLPSDTELPVMVRATGGHDLVTGRPLDFALVGVAVDGGTQHVNIAPLSTLAVLAAECAGGGVTAVRLTDARDRLGASLAMGLDGALVPDPLTDPVTQDNVESVVLANEALGEAVRRTVQALASAGLSTTADEVMQEVACDLVDVDASDPGRHQRIMAAFKGSELLVRLETLAGRLEVDGASAVARMDDAIRLVMPGFLNPSVASVPVNERARRQALDVLALLQTVADDDALIALAAAISGGTAGQARVLVDSALDASLHNDLYGLPERLALADESVVTALDQRRAQQPDVVRPTLALAAEPAAVTAGGGTTLSWATEGADVCVAGGGWNGRVGLTGVHATPALEETTVFELSCVGLGGAAKRAVTVSVEDAADPEPQPDPEPTLTFSAADSSVISGDTTGLSWSSQDATSCVASGGWSGGRATSGSESVGPLNADTTFSLTCTGPGGSVSRSVAVAVEPAPTPQPSLTLGAADTTVAYGGSTELSWSSSDAASCAASGGWSGTKATSGRESVGPLTADATFALTCTGSGGSVSRSAAVVVQPAPEPTVDLSASASVVNSGDPVQLTWTSEHADGCLADGGWSGERATSGSESAGPLTSRTTFSLTCSGDGGNAVSMMSVAVNGSVVLQWEPPTENVDGSPLTDLAGYRIYYGSSSGDYSNVLPIAAAGTTHSVPVESGTYYFAMTALDTDGNESAYSNEVIKTVD